MPKTPFCFGDSILTSGMDCNGMILSFGNFLSVTNSAREISDSKSLTTTALIQFEQTARAARSYVLSQESIS